MVQLVVLPLLRVLQVVELALLALAAVVAEPAALVVAELAQPRALLLAAVVAPAVELPNKLVVMVFVPRNPRVVLPMPQPLGVSNNPSSRISLVLLLRVNGH